MREEGTTPLPRGRPAEAGSDLAILEHPARTGKALREHKSRAGGIVLASRSKRRPRTTGAGRAVRHDRIMDALTQLQTMAEIINLARRARARITARHRLLIGEAEADRAGAEDRPTVVAADTLVAAGIPLQAVITADEGHDPSLKPLRLT